MRLATGFTIVLLFSVWLFIVFFGFEHAHDWWRHGRVAVGAIWFQLLPIVGLLLFCGIPIRVRRLRGDDAALFLAITLLVISTAFAIAWVVIVALSIWTGP